jgi:hypothetical protein
MCLAATAMACAGGSSINPPLPRGASEWFFVDNFTGQVGGFSAASGKLELIPGSSLNFSTGSPLPLVTIEVAPSGTFVAGILTDAQGAASWKSRTSPQGEPSRLRN